MTDQEFKRLNRSELIEVIYQFQVKVDELTQENKNLTAALEDKRLHIEQSGNIAEAALELNNVFQSAQSAAEQYLEEIRARHVETDAACRVIRSNAVVDAEAITVKARAEAAAVVAQARAEAATIIAQARVEAATIIEKAALQKVDLPLESAE